MIRYTILTILVLLSVFSVHAENTNSFLNYSISDGLVHKTVNCIVQDRDGFVWIGTSNGISRFDSYNFRNFKHSASNPRSLHGTSVYAIVESLDGKLWISTENGIEYFDKKTEIFAKSTIPELNDNQFAKSLHIDINGLIWVHNTVTGFLAFDPQTQDVKHHITKIPDVSVPNVYQFLVQNDTLWMAGFSGIAEYSVKTKELTFLDSTMKLFCYSSQKIDDTTLVMSFMQEGIYLINTATRQGRWASAETPYFDNGLKTIFFDATLGPDRSVWAGVTQGLINIKAGDYRCFHHFSEENYFGGGWVTCVFLDRNDNLLLGTNENGIYIKKKNSDFFKSTNRLFKGEIGKTEISHFDVFDDGSILYSNHRGVYLCPDYKDLSPHSAQLVNNAPATSIYHIDWTTCLIGSSDTIFRYDSRTRKITKLPKTILANSSACQTRDEILWFGTWIGILYGYDIKSDKIYTLYVDTVKNLKIPIFNMYADEDGSIWVATIGEGLLHIQYPASEHPIYEQYKVKTNGENSIASNIIHYITPDKEGNLWIATNGGGASKFNKRTKTFENFGAQSGLKSDIVESVVADNIGNVWFTSNVLSKYDIKTGVFTQFSESDGVGKSFIAKAARLTVNGDVIIANNSGFIVFDPDNLPQRKEVSVPQLTGLWLRGVLVTAGDTVEGQVPYTANITYSDRLRLPYEFNTFAIEFASIEIEESRNNQYEYKLEGLDRTWIPADVRSRLASYSGLQPGRYSFMVRASNEPGKWSEPHTISVVILPPWWQTWWFRVLFILAVILSIAAVILQRIRSLKSRNVSLEAIVAERTEELVQTTSMLQEQSDVLSRQAKSLQFSNKELQEQQVVIEMKNVQLEEALGAKDKLIGVIAHDFKNPLTAIQGLAMLLRNGLEQLPAAKARKYTETIYEASENLKNQMLVVLDWAQSRVQDLVYNPIEINIETIINDAILLVKESSAQKKITIITQFDYESNAFIDPRMMSTVLRNLLINAIKFSNPGGIVTVVVQEVDSGLEISIIDSGMGMSKDTVDNLFVNTAPHSSPGTESETGVGLGLQLCRSYVEQNQGVIRATSKPGTGSVFSVSVPKGLQNAVHSISSSVPKSDRHQSEEDLFEVDKSTTILVIDDDSNIVDLLKGIFEPYYNVVSANGGKMGIELARNIVPQLIISDINMPDITGVDLCQGLKNDEMTNHIPIILLTAEKVAEYWREGYVSGADDYMEKPFDKDLLQYKAKSLLDNRKKLTEQVRMTTPNKGFILPDSYDDALIKRVLEYINENFADSKLDINMVADEIGVSRTQLWRKFKSKTGVNPSDYILELRMEKAKEMLVSGNYKVAEVAYDVGYSNPQYFTKCFSQYFGAAPREYADKMKVN